MYNEELGVKPFVLLENRIGQFISNGREILSFCNFITKYSQGFERQVVYSARCQKTLYCYEEALLEEAKNILLGSITGLHIRDDLRRHKIHSENENTHWRQVFNKIKQIQHKILINPRGPKQKLSRTRN